MTDEPLRATISQKAILFDPDDEDVLLLLQEDGPWELPGGRIGADEDVEKGLRREVREETGIDATIVYPVHTAAWHNEQDRGRFAVVYRCRADRREVRLSDEHVHWRWIPPEAAVEFPLARPAFRVALERSMSDPARRVAAERTDRKPRLDGTSE